MFAVQTTEARLPRAKRRARNQALFSEVNERIADAFADFAAVDLELLCECGRVGCKGPIHISAGAYAPVRDDLTMFVVLKGHEDEGRETVIADDGNYLIVKARPGAGSRSSLAFVT